MIYQNINGHKVLLSTNDDEIIVDKTVALMANQQHVP